MAMAVDENSKSESDTEELPFEKISINTDYKIKTSLEEPPIDHELKPLPKNLEYVFLERPSFLPVIISSKLSAQNKSKLISVLKKHKEAFAWKTTDILSICPSFCKHKIQLLDDKKPFVQKQRRLNLNIQEVVKKEIVKLLDTDTFQRCMLEIFHDMIKESVEVFMDNFPIFGYSFDKFLNNLDKMLQRCRDAHVVINWEECHFMVKEGIVLGHKVSSAGLEVDKAKINVISKLSSPTNIKVKNTNRALKIILKKTVKDNPAIWSRKLDDALWAFRIAYKTPTGTTPYKLIYGKNYHLSFEIKHRAYWALKNRNADLIAATKKRMFQLHELDELRHQAYENSRLYKARTKVWHDRKLRMRKEFKHGNKVLLFHSKYKFKQPKLKFRWLGPYIVKRQYPSGYVKLFGKDGKTFIVNGHRLKLYHEEEDYNDQREAVTPFFPKE
nr:hypothetical protein [Tanacetum cinerariifolium]